MFGEDTIAPDAPELSDSDEFGGALDSVITFKKVLKPYRALARWIAPTIHPFMDLTRAFFAGVPEVGAAEEEDQDGDSEEELHVFNCIMKLGRGFHSLVDGCKSKPDRLLTVIEEFSDAANEARADDTGKLKFAILNYMYEDPKAGSSFKDLEGYEILLPNDLKDSRGFRHIDTANFLCPLRLKEEFEKDPLGFMDRVEDASLQLTADDFPSFLYEGGTIYDEDNEDIHLFRGFLLVRAYRHIFTGPSSALNPNSRGPHKTKAKKFKLTKVTGRTIAYASVQTYIALSSMGQWGSYDGVFDLEALYSTIVTMFESDRDDPWVVETLEWWNEQVPGLRAVSKRKKKSAPNAPTHTRPPPVDRIIAQRAQRRRNRDGNQPQQANLARPAPIIMGDQGGNIADGEDIQPDNDLEGLPLPNAEDDLGDGLGEPQAVVNSRRRRNLPPNSDVEHEERDEGEEASRRYQGEEQERERIAEREKRQNLPRPIPRVTFTLKPKPALPPQPQALLLATENINHQELVEKHPTREKRQRPGMSMAVSSSAVVVGQGPLPVGGEDENTGIQQPPTKRARAMVSTNPPAIQKSAAVRKSTATKKPSMTKSKKK